MQVWFNEYQQEYIKDLESIPPEQKCWCGWFKLGECPHCPPGKTCADKMAVWCPDCHNDPGPTGGVITHRRGCSINGLLSITKFTQVETQYESYRS